MIKESFLASPFCCAVAVAAYRSIGLAVTSFKASASRV